MAETKQPNTADANAQATVGGAVILLILLLLIIALGRGCPLCSLFWDSLVSNIPETEREDPRVGRQREFNHAYAEVQRRRGARRYTEQTEGRRIGWEEFNSMPLVVIDSRDTTLADGQTWNAQTIEVHTDDWFSVSLFPVEMPAVWSIERITKGSSLVWREKKFLWWNKQKAVEWRRHMRVGSIDKLTLRTGGSTGIRFRLFFRPTDGEVYSSAK